MEYVVLLLVLLVIIHFSSSVKNRSKKTVAKKKTNTNVENDLYSSIRNEPFSPFNNIHPDLVKKYVSDAINTANKIAKEHAVQLAIQRKKNISTDSYGKTLDSNWATKERSYFINAHIRPSLPRPKELNNLQNEYLILSLHEEFNKIVDEIAIETKIPKVEFDQNMNGHDFEFFCEQKLRAEGWQVTRTKGSGDQGIDLVIHKGKRKVGVQCKKFSSPVTNKAVQEVKAGIAHYHLNEGIVLTNSTFSKSAIQLAESNDIRLFHFLETSKI